MKHLNIMKSRIFFLICIVGALFAFAACSDDAEKFDLDGDCLVEKVVLDGYEGVIDHAERTITVTVPETYSKAAMKVNALKLSSGAVCNIREGEVLNMEAAVVLHVVNGDVFMDWTLIARNFKPAIKPAALFVGSAYSKDELDMEAQAACEWMTANVPNAFYASFEDIANGTADLSECKLIWWHWHDDHGVDGHDGFLAKGTDALNVKNQLKAFRENGGALLLTRYATHLPTFIGVTGDDEWTMPNNCWGDPEMNAFDCGGPWAFDIYAGQENHPMWENMVNDGFEGKVPLTDAGYFVSNSVAQYHIGSDWGGYDNYQAWEDRNGGNILGVGGDGAIVAWEYPAADGKGGIVCIGYGGYDWYSYRYGSGYTEHYHKNTEIITKNAIDYLTK